MLDFRKMGKKRKEKVILPPPLPPDLDDEEIQVSDEDIDFVNENRKFAQHLNFLDTDSITRYVTRVPDMKEDELEARYEERSRKASSLKKEEESKFQVDPVDALPIKTLDGELKYRTVVETKSEGALDNTESRSSGIERPSKAERRAQTKKERKEAKKLGKHEEIVDGGKEKMHSDVLAKVEEELSAEELFRKKKIRLAEVGLQLLENPEANISTLKELLKMCEDKDENVVKLGLMSLLAVFKDIIPGYRIRLPTEKELEMTVSKAVRQTRFYESTLLRSYKAYLGKLITLGKQATFNQIAVRCLCSLLEAVPHFNFQETLLSAVVKNINSSDGFVRKLACEAIKSIFKNEGKHGGEATLEAVRLIANRVKIFDCNLHPDSIAVLLSLTFDEDLGKPDPSEENVKPKMKGKRKRHEDLCSDRKKSRQELMTKTREEVNLGFKAVSFAPDSKKRKRIQSETLSAVFGIYFRVLKHCMDLPSASSEVKNYAVSGGIGAHPLLAPCLDGLGKFSHLIDLDFMGDLMNCLRKLSGFRDQLDGFPSGNGLSVSERLRCCVVAFRVMRNNLDALNVDLQDFFVHLYNLLLEYTPERDQGEVLAEALKIMLCEGKHHDLQRTAAFVKRLSTFSLTFGSAEAMAALVTLKHLLQKNSKCRNLLDNDSGGGSLCGLVAKYQPDATDPNLSGALASVLWELSLLKKHYDPSISSMAASISSMADINPTQSQVYLSTASPLQAFMDLSIEKDLFKTAGRPPSLSRKRKREQEKNSIVDLDQLQSIGNGLDVDEIKRKMEGHFTVHKSIKDNEKLRRELNVTLASLSLYKEYKKQKKGNTSSKLRGKIK